uniref:Uncharacterized protein n=1 Tax=Branchiostoma floridae TaxID=7739 RepID=C3YIC0_BRAFL|eukprot:XP_002604246.1 hypothetical protein BRAFLDRAFT_73414 [Branchiostoma floridae]
MAAAIEQWGQVDYIEQKPTKSIPRNAKIGTHWARVFYNGQEPDQGRKTDDQDYGKDETKATASSPTTEANMDYIDKAYEEHVRKDDISDIGETRSTQDEQEEISVEENDNDTELSSHKSDESERNVNVKETTTKANTRTSKRKTKQTKKHQEKKKNNNDNDNDPPRTEEKQKEKKQTSRRRSNSLGDIDEARMSSILNYLRKTKESQSTKRPRESSSSSETAQTLPAKKPQMEGRQQRKSSSAEQQVDGHAVT